MNSVTLILLYAVLSCVFCHCRQDPSDRAHKDLNTGQGLVGSVSFKSEDGLLHVREASASRLRLRAGAPGFALTFNGTEAPATTFGLIIENIHPATSVSFDPVLQLLSGPDTGAKPTEKIWNVTIPANTPEATLRAEPGESRPFTFVALGDIQDGIDGFGKVIDILNQQEDSDFLMFLGDVTMEADRQEFLKVEEQFDRLRFPVFATPGNHDVSSKNRYHDFFGRASYSFVYRGARFTSVDSGSWTLSREVWKWYKDWLKEGENQTHIVFSHIAPTEPNGIRGGHWKSRREANTFLAHASRHRVDSMFFGHLHTLDIYRLAGIPAYISGGAGAFEEKLDGIKRHFLTVRVDPESSLVQVSVTVID